MSGEFEARLEQKCGEWVENTQGYALPDPIYLQIAKWIQDQARWVTLPHIMTAFGLSRTQVYSHIVTLRKKCPGCLEERRERRGGHSLISVRVVEGWDIPTRPVQNRPRTCHFLSSVEGMVVPVPRRREHCRWLQLTQRHWHQMHLARCEVDDTIRNWPVRE